MSRLIGIVALWAVLIAGGNGFKAVEQESVVAPGPFDLFMAPTGEDGHPGTKERPLRSLEAARDTVRKRRANGEQRRPVTVWIHGGFYPRTNTFKLQAEDSGTAQAPMNYRAWPGERPRFVGGQVIPAEWCTPVTDDFVLSRLDPSVREKVRCLDLRERGMTNYGEMSILAPMLEVFCEGRRLPLARWPNEGWAKIAAAVKIAADGRRERVDGDQSGRAFAYVGNRPRLWLGAKDLVLHGFWWFGWMDQQMAVKSINIEASEITLKEGPGGGIRKDQWYCALNVLEEIDMPGEWYLDRACGRLYLYPPGEFPQKSLIVSTLAEPLLVLDSASHVIVRGLTFEVTRGVAVVIVGGARNKLAGCTIRAVGSDAVVIDHGGDNGLVGCDIHDVGGTAVRITGGNRSTLDPAHNHVVNSHIFRYAQRKKVYQPAVRLYGVGHRIAHNLIHDAPHQAIGYDGNDHVIEFNEIHNVVLESSDAGVLYTGCDWTFRGNVVRHNFIHHIPHGPGLGTVGVYLDDCCSSTAILGNVFFDMNKPAFIGGGRDNRIENNIFIQCEFPVYLDSRGLRWEHFRPEGPMYESLRRVPYAQPPWSTRYPELARILDEIPQAPLGNVVARNVVVRSTWRDPEKYCRDTSKKNIDRPYVKLEDNWITDDDPGFVDAERMDFCLRPDAAVWKKVPGFISIPFEKIGPYADDLRADWLLPGAPRPASSPETPEKSLEFHVSPTGDDRHTGMQSVPFHTLEAARDAIRQRRQAGDTNRPVTVWIHGGVYERERTFELTEQDSGTTSAPVVYRAAPGEVPRLVGGKTLNHAWFEPVRDDAIRARFAPRLRERVRQIDLRRRGITDLGELGGHTGGLELFCGGRRLPIARWPNGDWALARWLTVEDHTPTARADNALAADAAPTGVLRFKYSGEGPRRWSSHEGVWIRGYFHQEYCFDAWQVKGIDPRAQQITLGHRADPHLKEWRRFYAVNVLEELDQPEEWYLDRSRGILYFYPPADFDREMFQVSMLTQPLISLHETRYVTVQGLTLGVSRGEGVIVSGGANNRIANCTMRGLLRGAILAGGANNGIVGCELHDLAALGIRMGGGDRATLTPAGLYVEDCHIHNYARQLKTWQPGVRVEGVGNRVAHCHIHDAPQYAISYDGNDHVFEFNDLHDLCLEMSDVGVIGCGTDWTIRGNIVRYNFIHDIPDRPYPGTAGVYLDNCASSTTIIGNVFRRVYQAVFIGGGRDNVIENNIFLECDKPVHLDNRGLRWDHFRPGGPMYDLLKKYHHDKPPYSTRYPELARILQESPQAPLGNILRRNVSVRSSWRDPEEECRKTFSTHIATKYMEIGDNFVTEDDPGFVDLAGGDLRLREDAIVYRKIPAFRAIPFESIGPHQKAQNP
jgi:parallel beta-helix repeat protein